MTDPNFETVRVKPVQDAYEAHRSTLARIVNIGATHEWGGFPAHRLPNTVTFRRAGRAGLNLTHVQPVAFGVYSDAPDIQHVGLQGQDIDVFPSLSMRLQQGSSADTGIVAVLRFAELE